MSVTIPFVAVCQGGDGQGLVAPLLDRLLASATIRHGAITGPRPGSRELSGSYKFRPGPAQTARVTARLAGRLSRRSAAGTLDISAALQTNQGTHALPTCSAHLRWRAPLSARPRRLAAPDRARPRPLFYGVVLFRVSGDPFTPGQYLEQLVPPHTEQYALTPSSSNGAQALTVPPPNAADSQPATNETGRPLAFVRTVNGVPQVEAFEPMSSIGVPFSSPLLEPRVTTFRDGARDPAVSPMGLIAFSAGSGADCSLWVTDLQTWQPRQATDHGGRPGCDTAPAWSPDGRLAFRRTLTDDAGNAVSLEYLVMDSPGATVQRLDFGQQQPEAFSWYPGRDLVFVVRDRLTGEATLQTMSADSSNRRTLLRSPRLVGRPVWSPTRDQILFETTDSGSGRDLMRMAVRDQQVHPVTNTPGVTETDAVWTEPLSSVGGLSGGPGIHVKSQSAEPHRRKRQPARARARNG